MGKEKRGLIDPGPVMGEFRTVARYEEFIREGIKESYRAEWHPGEQAPFLGSERFIKKMVKEKTPPPVSRRTSMRELLKRIAVKSGFEPGGNASQRPDGKDGADAGQIHFRGGLRAWISGFGGGGLSRLSSV